MTDLVTIDISSAFNVVMGYTCCHVYRASDTEFDMYRKISVFFVSDLWLATLLSCFLGSLWHLSLHTFHFIDLLLTIGEGLTSLRQFEFNQHEEAAHTLNPFAWLITCLFIPAFLLPYTYSATERMHSAFNDFGIYVIVTLCVSGVLLFSVFASLHDNTNIFYSSASSVGYRMLEFNMGVNLYYLTYVREPVTMMIVTVTARLKVVVMTLFACVWWSEFGVKQRASQTETCVRLYHFNACLVDHPGVLLRGCLLGISVVAWACADTDTTIHHIQPLTLMMNYMSMVLLCFPLFIVIKGGLQLSFTTAMVDQNSALLSLLMPVSVFCMVYAYNLHIKPLFEHDLQTILFECYRRIHFRRRSAQPDSSASRLCPDSHVEARQTFDLLTVQ